MGSLDWSQCSVVEGIPDIRAAHATDKSIRYQQNLKGRRLAIVVLRNSTWRVVRRRLDFIAEAVNQATPGS
ncbi:MAG TPA: hypothetical protein VEV85_20915 [Bryobacteraceae bacterium]|nr:hypothetical protein [Bryobacteraceae bacterium]